MAASEHPSLSDATLTVYPTALKARAVVAARARSDGIVLGAAVTTFPELVDRLATELGVAADMLPPALARVVLESVIRRRRPALGERRGLVREAHDVIEELEAAHLSAADVTAIARTASDSEAAVRLEEIADVYAGYEEALARLGVVDRHGRTRAVADRLAAAVAREAGPRFLRGVRRLVFAEIYDYSVLQFLLATSLIRLVGDAELIAFAHPENVAATRFLDRTWNRFVGAEPIADQVLPSFVRREGRGGAIASLLRGVFAPDRPPPAEPDESVRVVVAPHRYGEVEAVLRDVRARLRGGAPAERVGILARDMTVYRDRLLDVARRFAVPIEVRRPGDCAAGGAARYVLDLWRVAADGLPRVALASALDADYVGGRPGRVARLLARVGYVAERVATVEECLAAARQRGERAAAHEPRGLLRRVRAIRDLARPRSVLGHARAMRRALSALGFRPVAGEEAHPGVAARDATAAAAVTDALLDLAALDRMLGLGRAGAREMADLVGSVLADAAPPAGTPGAGGVRALSVHDARGLDFDVVYVLGLDDGTFPMPQRESVLLPDWLRRQVNPAAAAILRERLGERAAGLPLGALLRTAREGQLEDPFLFFLAASMAERELVLVRPASDDAGTPCVPSPFLDEVAACFAGPVPTTVLPAAQLVPRADECAEAREVLVRVAFDRWRGDESFADRLGAALVARMPEMRGRVDAIDRRVAMELGRRRFFLTPGDAGGARATLADAAVGRVGPAEGLPDAIAARAWSASAVERLAACGFKFLAADLLGLREAPDPAADADAREGGVLLHAALGAVVAREDLPADPLRRAEAVRALLAARREEIMAGMPPKDRAVAAEGWARVVEAVVEVLDVEAARWASGPAGRRSKYVEWRFEQQLAGRRLHGRADLVDVVDGEDGTRYVTVTDYKSRRDGKDFSRRLDPQRDLGVTAFQVPLYLAAAAAAFGRGAGRVRLEGRLVAAYAPAGRKVVAAELAPETVADVAERTSALLSSAGAGRFDVDPRLCDEWCEYRTVCRYVRPPTEEDEDG